MKTTNRFNSIKRNRTLAALCLASLMFTAPAVQAEKVVVIPLGSKTYIGASIFWTGAWRDNFQYVLGDGMQHGGSSYICVRDHVSSADNTPPNDIYWSLMAEKGGVKGDTGPTGPEGPAGPKGDQGDPGTNGTDGAKGDQGDPGTNGADGAKGDKGDPGTNGTDGAKGDKGDPGTNGSDGPKGDKGDPGTNGADGAKGDKGDPGTSLWLDATGQVTTVEKVGIGVGAATPGAKLHVDGGVMLGNDAAACDGSKTGTIRWSGTDFEGCNGTAWSSLTPTEAATHDVLCANFPLVLSDFGKIWMACNMGAIRVAQIFDDAEAYGDLYQWGRPTDGHE